MAVLHRVYCIVHCLFRVKGDRVLTPLRTISGNYHVHCLFRVKGDRVLTLLRKFGRHSHLGTFIYFFFLFCSPEQLMGVLIVYLSLRRQPIVRPSVHTNGPLLGTLKYQNFSTFSNTVSTQEVSNCKSVRPSVHNFKHLLL